METVSEDQRPALDLTLDLQISAITILLKHFTDVSLVWNNSFNTSNGWQ